MPVIREEKGLMDMRRSIAAMLAVCLTLSCLQSASAGMIGTGEVLAGADRAARMERVEAALAGADVQRQLVALGVEPADAAQRVAALSDAELATLDAHLSDLPAGGDSVLAVIGIVFVVLFILEITGVTDIFKRV
jgi:hypothetical protein